MTDLANQSKTTIARGKRLSSEPAPTALEAKRVCNPEVHSISTQLADVEREFQRREEEKKALFI
jgi:hypothetical protein